jgi:tetratricopeptide (TPR) repeat protein
MDRLFLTPGERQLEIERLCTDRKPAFGYAVLSGLMEIDDGAFNVVLTTNFDDLVEDAVLTFRRKRPLVIHHDSLAPFIRPMRMRPLIVKLHGDHQLAPRNTVEETAALDEHMSQRISTVLHDRGLIFLGYGGNDESIVAMLETLPEESLQFGVYWVSSHEPRGRFRPWLEDRRGLWVDYGNFDELMLLFRNEFDVPHPLPETYETIFGDYGEVFSKLSNAINDAPDGRPESTPLKEAVKEAEQSLPVSVRAWISAVEKARTNPDRLNTRNTPTLGGYADVHRDIRKDLDRAEEYYKHKIETDPKDATALGNYAFFLNEARHDADQAEEFYKRAIAADSHNAWCLRQYAYFLREVRKDSERAKEYEKRAINADPTNHRYFGS